jgi:hypothetical protein
MNIDYAGFPSLGFEGKTICVMFVFSIVLFYSFTKNMFVVNIVQG